MAFPTTPTTGANTLIASVQGTATTTHTFGSLTTLDNASGDLLIAVIVLYQASATGNAFSAWGGGFTEFGDSSSATNPSMAMGCAYKISNGTETGTFTVTSSISGRSAMFLMSIKNWHGTTPPEVAFSAATTATAQDPPNLDPPGWGAEDTLWIAVAAGGETSLTGTWTGIASAPASYTNFAASSIAGGDVIGACQIAVAFRGNNITGENPGSFTTDTSPEIERAATIAVRPAPPPVELDGTQTATASIAGTAAVDHTLAGTLAATATIDGSFDVTSGTTPVEVDGTLAATGTITGTATVDHTLDGTRTATATLTGALALDHPLSGTLAATATLAGTATVTHPMDGTRTATATITGAFDVAQPGQVNLDGTRAGTATISGAFNVTSPITVDGGRPVTATISGAATVTHTLDGTRTAVATIGGTVNYAAALAGTLQAQATISGSVEVGAAYTPMLSYMDVDLDTITGYHDSGSTGSAGHESRTSLSGAVS
jgi:hypothetical protein